MNWQPGILPPKFIPFADLYSEQRQLRSKNRRIAMQELSRLGLMLSVLGLVLLPLIALTFQWKGQVRRLKGEADAIQREAQTLQDKSAGYESRVMEWTQFQASQEQRRMWADIPRFLAVNIPGDVLVEQVQVDAKTKQEEITITGVAGGMDSLQRFRAALNKMSIFTDFSVAEVNTLSEVGKYALRFRIKSQGKGALSPKQ